MPSVNATTPRVLVAYASKHGTTAEIAERIGRTLRGAGLAADLARAGRVDDLQRYDAVVLGSAVYMGRWRREAAAFLKRHEAALAERPVWLFSSGPTGEGDPRELTGGWVFPKALEPIAERIAPRDIALFHGALDADELGAVERFMISRVGAPQGDWRDPDAIDAWAEGIARELAGSVASV